MTGASEDVGVDGDGVPSKKVKTGSQIDGLSVRWEWEGDKSTWTQYSDDKNESISDAFNAKQSSVCIKNFKFFNLKTKSVS